MNTLRALTGGLWLWLGVIATGAAGREAFVQVADGPLYFSPQVHARDLTGDAAAQAESALATLVGQVTAAGGRRETVARLNAYVRSPDDRVAIERTVSSFVVKDL